MNRLIVPGLATVALGLLFSHTSESPTVLRRYSAEYTILIILSILNVSLLWRQAISGFSYRRLIHRLSLGRAVTLVAGTISTLFLIDFVIGIGFPPTLGNPVGCLVLIVLLGLFLQVETLGEQFGYGLVLVTCSLTFAVIAVDFVFSFGLALRLTPKSQLEFQRLMSSSRGQASQVPQSVLVPKPAGTFRILGLADSYGVVGGAANYHYLVEHTLRREVSSKIQIVNVSVGGNQLPHELALIGFAIAYSPDLVLHGFYVGNDFLLTREDMYLYGNIWVLRQVGRAPYRPRYFLVREWIENYLQRFQDMRRKRHEAMNGVMEGTYSKSAFLRGEFTAMGTWAKRTQMENMKKVFPVLDDIRSVATKAGARYVMVIHPSQIQVDDELRGDIMTTFGMREEEYDFELGQRVLGSYCADRGIPCLDLLPAFRARRQHRDLFLLRDGHYNREGNEVAAARISEFLRAELNVFMRLRADNR